jgi:hypothetical protein
MIMTSRPARRNSRAVSKPLMPPPIISISVCMVMKKINWLNVQLLLPSDGWWQLDFSCSDKLAMVGKTNASGECLLKVTHKLTK